jgi:tetratricopeptide (TPR) repeat protein
LLQRVLASEPDDVDALCRLALAYMKLGDRRRQLEAAERALACNPHSEWACRLQFDALHALRRNKQALTAARRAVELAPTEPLAHVCLVQGLLAMHRTHTLLFSLPSRRRELRARADRLVELAPSRSVAHQMRGLVALHQRRLRDAEGSFRRALALDPESAVDLNNLGVALLRQRRSKEALDAFEGAARLDPTLAIARNNLALSIKRELAAGAGVVGLAIGYFALRDVLPRAAAPFLLAPFLGGMIALYALRIRKLSPTAQRFARAEGLVTPRGFPPWQGLVLTIVAMSSLVSGLMELVWLWLTPSRAVHWLPWGALFAATIAVFAWSARALRRAGQRR